MNSFNIAGRVVDDPVKSTSSNGYNLSRIKISVDKNNKDGSTNGYEIFEVTVFRELAEMKIQVGDVIGVTGRLSANNYDKEGKQYFNCQMIGSQITLLGK